MLKGKIIKIIDDEAIVMTSNFDFLRIKKPEETGIGKEVAFSDEELLTGK